jgi:hypothetical protein
MFVAAKGRVQGRAATLLLLWAGFSFFFFVFMQQKFHFHSVVGFFLGLLVTNGDIRSANFMAFSYPVTRILI